MVSAAADCEWMTHGSERSSFFKKRHFKKVEDSGDSEATRHVVVVVKNRRWSTEKKEFQEKRIVIDIDQYQFEVFVGHLTKCMDAVQMPTRYYVYL